MSYTDPMIVASRILVVQPNWVGDSVMATPMLRAVRELYPNSHIAYLMRRYVKPIYTGMPWADQLLTYRTGKTTARAGRGVFFDLAARLRAGKFDMAILLPNSFRAALICKMARIKRILGYERDGRGFLLSDRLLPAKERGKFIPTPMLRTYMGLARYLGAPGRDCHMELFVTPSERRDAETILKNADLDPAAGRSPESPWVLLNPGANYGAAKCWLPDYFAQVADQLITRHNATVLISAAPRERAIVSAILAQSAQAPRLVDLSAHGLTLGALKEIVRRCDLMITNDTGPRHIAAAMDTPVITIFGPTDPAWTQINYPRERQLSVPVFCGPCQRKTCPLDHRCMTRVTPAMVMRAAEELLGKMAVAS